MNNRILPIMKKTPLFDFGHIISALSNIWPKPNCTAALCQTSVQLFIMTAQIQNQYLQK